jgi:hypothetical protein
MVKRLLAFLNPLCHSHLVGILIALFAYIGMIDTASTLVRIPAAVGLRCRTVLLASIPITCLGCLIVFLLSPVGNQSRFAIIRGIGKIPVLGRYLAFAGIAYIIVSLSFLLFSQVGEIELSSQMSPESLARIEQEVGGGVAIGVRQVFFLKEKQVAVQRALKKEHIKVEE